jgi:hypothetical protein
MPNWVMNELSCIFQTQEEYNAFKMKAKIESLFNSFFPMPEVLEGTIAPHRNPEEFIAKVNQTKGTKFLTLEGIALGGDDTWDANLAKGLIKNMKAFEQTGYHDWYSWNLDNWGVKWEAKDCKAKELSDFNTIIFSFDTAWGTPEHFVREISKKYPTATFEMVSGSIENDCHYEFTCEDGKFEETCSYDSFREAVEDGKWGGWDEWAELFEESEEV